MVAQSPSTQASPLPEPRRILFITAHFPPNQRAGTHRLLRFVRHLDAFGWAVSVLTFDPESYLPDVRLDERLSAEIPPNVRVVRTRVPGRKRRSHVHSSAAAPTSSPAGRPREDGWLKGQLRSLWRKLWSTPDRELGWWWTAVPAGVRLVRQGGAEIIVSSAPPFTCHLIAAEISRRAGVPWVADFRDPWSRAPWGLEWRNRGWTGWVHRRLERLTVRRAHAVILNTRQMRDDFVAHYDAATASKFITIPNGFDGEALRRNLQPVPRSAPTSTLVLCHTGSLYQARDPRPLLRALARLRDSGTVPRDAFRVQFVGGDGGEFGTHEELRRLDLQSVVEFVPPVPHGESLGYLCAADVLLVVQPDTQVQVPVKLYEYLWARKPVLALASEGAVAELIRESGAGLVVSPTAESDIADALKRLYLERASLSTSFVVCESILEQLDGPVLSRRLLNLLEHVLAAHGHADSNAKGLS